MSFLLAHVGPHGADLPTLIVEAVCVVLALIAYWPMLSAYLRERLRR